MIGKIAIIGGGNIGGVCVSEIASRRLARQAALPRGPDTAPAALRQRGLANAADPDIAPLFRPRTLTAAHAVETVSRDIVRSPGSQHIAH